MEVGFKTDKGVRRTNNEDAFFVMSHDGIYILADGVGGTNSGEIASRTAVNEIAQYFEDNPLAGGTTEDICREMNKALQRANYRVFDMALRFSANRGMATTIIFACVRGKDIYICNVGDSRAYLYDGKGLIRLTEDHTYVNELVKAGIITKEEAEMREDKNKITRAVGAEYEITPDFFHVTYKENCKLLLCTDGLHDEVPEVDIAAVFDEDLSMIETCDTLVAMANENGGNDNITVIAVRLMEDE